MKVTFLVLGLVSVFLGSCTISDPCANKTNLKEAMAAVVEKAKTIAEGEAAGDWVKVDEKFNQYMQQCYVSVKEEMTASERIDFYEDVISFSEYRDDRKYRLKQILEDAEITIEEELENLVSKGQRS